MNLQARATNMLTQPAQEWRVIEGEPADVASLLRDYAAPLSAIPAIATWLGNSVVGFGGYRMGIVSGFTTAIVTWVFGLAGCWIAAIVVEKLAPTFASRGNTTQALKLVVFSMTAAWLAGVLDVLPMLRMLVLIGALYSLYLFYVGLPIVMHTPADKVVPYMVVSAIAVILVTFCVFWIAGLLTFGALT